MRHVEGDRATLQAGNIDIGLFRRPAVRSPQRPTRRPGKPTRQPTRAPGKPTRRPTRVPGRPTRQPTRIPGKPTRQPTRGTRPTRVPGRPTTMRPGTTRRPCTVPFAWFFWGNKVCHDLLNTEECGWDGGDCCGKSWFPFQFAFCRECKCKDPKNTNNAK